MAQTSTGIEPRPPGGRYRGRFAPSPTGPLHRGSLVAAIASYLQAHAHHGEWLLRIEDIDPPRAVSGAADAIIGALQAHGFRWHGDILYQRHNTQRFSAVVARLLDSGLAYACTCSRAELRRTARSGATGVIYPGTCRQRALSPDGDPPTAIRISTAGATVAFEDRLQGRIECEIEREIGDFIIRRKDGLIAYSLAVALDDHDQGMTEIVRGADLLDFTSAQIYLQQVLGLARPTYCHVPVVATADGTKLSKQTGATALDNSRAAGNLVEGLTFLGQCPPAQLATATVDEVWSWARDNWRLDAVVR